MIKGILLLLIGIVAVSCTPLEKGINSSRNGKMNVILFSIDTLRADSMELYGHRKKTAPFLSSFAKENIFAKHAYATSSNTLPSHLSMLTGLYPDEHTVIDAKRNQSLPAKFKTIAEMLSAANYSTFWFASTTNQHLHERFGFHRGFEKVVPGGVYREDRVDRAIAELKASKKPFFAFMHNSLVHDPYVYMPKNDESCHKVARSKYWIDKQNEYLKVYGPSKGWEKYTKEYWKSYDISKPEDVRLLKEAYECTIRRADQIAKYLIERLNQEGMLDSTAVLFTADHGEAFGEHGRFRHITLHREILKVPLIAYVPKMPKQVIDKPVSLVDLVATICEITRGDCPSGSGVSIFAPKQSRFLFARYSQNIAIFNEELKYMMHIHDGEEFYHIKEDPFEKKSLILSQDRFTPLKKAAQKMSPRLFNQITY